MPVGNRMSRRSTMTALGATRRSRQRRLLLEQLEFRSLLAADATISGLKWEDLNGNGLREAGEPPMAGVTVYLDTNDNGSRDAGEVFTATAADGTYSFPALQPGNYVVREELPVNYRQTSPLVSGTRLFVTDTVASPDRILELNPATVAQINSIPAPVPTGSTTTGLAFDGQTLFFLSDTNDILFRLNPDTGVLLGSGVTLPSRTYGGLASLGGLLYALDSTGEDVLRLNPATG